MARSPRRSRRAPGTPTPAPGAAPAAPPAIRTHALVSLAAVVTFARAVPYPLQASWDDGRFIVDDDHVHEVSWRALRAIFGAQHFEAYHPLHLLSYWLDVPWAGAHGPTLHAVSLALWVVALNLLLRGFAALGLGTTSAALATLAFGLHPIQVEAVSWASGRKDVLAVLFSAAALLLHLRASGWASASAWLSRAAYACAVLAKTSAVPLPGVLMLADVLLRRRSWREALRFQWPSLLLACGAGAGVLAIWSEHQMIRTTEGGVAALPARMAATVAHQLATALWPSATSPMYATHDLAARPVGPLLVLAGLVLAGVWARRRGAVRALFALSAFALWIAPVSNAVPMYFPFQDRYLSLPLVGLAFGLGAALDALRSARVRIALGATLVLVLAARCVQYQGEWRSEPRLWGHAAATQPDAFYAWMKLGEVRRRAGDLDGAIRAYRRLVDLDPRRKVARAALLHAVALRDERLRRLAPSRADRHAREYYENLDDPDALLALAGRMLQTGHVRALELPLARSFELRQPPDAALERAAETHFREGRPTLGAFYLRSMQVPSARADLNEQRAAIEPALRASPL